MSQNASADRARLTALDEVDRQERQSLIWLVVAAIAEATGLVVYLVLMDFSNTLHWLILVAACLVYATLIFSMAALRTDLQTSMLRILRAIEEIGGAAGGEERGGEAVVVTGGSGR